MSWLLLMSVFTYCIIGELLWCRWEQAYYNAVLPSTARFMLFFFLCLIVWPYLYYLFYRKGLKNKDEVEVPEELK